MDMKEDFSGNGSNSGNSSDFNYVEQRITPKKRRNRLRKILITLLVAVVAAAIFGVVARFMFTASGEWVGRVLGIEPTAMPSQPTYAPTREPVKLTGQAQSGSTGSQTPTAIPVTEAVPATEAAVTGTGEGTAGAGEATAAVTATETPAVEPVIIDTPSPTEEPAGTDDDPAGGSDSGAGGAGTEQESALESYIRIISEMRAVAEDSYRSLAVISAVTSGINWMDENIETKTYSTGVIMADNGVELLVLTRASAVAGADRLEVTFGNGETVSGELFSSDSDYDLAVIAIPLEDIADDNPSKESCITFDSSRKIRTGDPVIAIGSPGGSAGAIQYGFISGTDKIAYTIDGYVNQFTTDMGFSAQSDGIIIDLNGSMIGLITGAFLGEGEQTSCSAVSVSSIEEVLLALLNGTHMPSFGIRAENIPEDVLESMGIENGIYVNEAIASTPAANGGIHKGDVIISIDNVKVTGVEQFRSLLFEGGTSRSVIVKVYRSSRRDDPFEELTVRVTVKK